MKTAFLICVILLITTKTVNSGPVAGGICCTGCCAGTLVLPGVGIGVFGGCEVTCLTTLGGFPPQCMLCAAIFLAPTP
ncbi:unnamed protein product [Didymodactylos carnosus]|uniref:Uncharacterized protein n=1 Tax=Didymodactylos carnosus TaxID=1234261 RepID=A0A8S2SH53_9BILA|nr:unnamed protein product [Didymodactylos carnosus]CAF4201349.1 unnamed protein product [Didymodactylos carnosus]